jgi:tripartite-type tricarboxylate transporter receptor subunit TctC
MRVWPFVMMTALGAASALAAEYPSRPIRMIVPFTAGSATDLLARMIGSEMTKSWGQQIVVDNRPSAGGMVAGGIVAGAAPDGHTIMVTSSGFAGAAALYDKLPYDPHRDFAGVTLIAVTPILLIASPNLGVKTVKELIALAQQKPGELNFGSSGIGSGTHYGAELFNLAAKIRAVHVPYKGTPEVATEVMSGRLHYSMAPVLPSTPLVRAGRLIALGITSPQRLPMLPDVPTIAEAAIPGFVYEGWYGVFVPSATPRAIVQMLSAEVGRILELPDIHERISREGTTPRPSSPEAFTRMVHDEIATRKKVFKAAGTKAN